MKKVIYNKVLVATLFLGSPMVSAGTQYPAADFEPKVLYQDSDYKHQKSSTSSTSKSTTTSKPDSRYPAANFEPSVVYQDEGYKHSKSTSSKAASSASQSEISGSTETASAEQEESSSSIFIGLIVLAVAGFMFFKKTAVGQGAKKKAPARARRVSKKTSQTSKKAVPTGATGVARYLSKNNPATSSVAKYLENRNQNPTSGVAKYVAKKVVSAKQAAAAKTTGVEKYLRNRS